MESLPPSLDEPAGMVHPCGVSRYARPFMLLLFAMLLIPQGALAHPPSDLQLGFREGDRLLSVTITHTVADPATHFVARVLITAGGRTINDTAYTSQPAASTFTLAYPLPQGISGEVQVKADCSIAGSRSSAVLIPGPQPRGTPVPTASIPATAGTSIPRTAAETGLPAATATETTRATPGTTPTRAGAGLFSLAAAAALAAWRFRR